MQTNNFFSLEQVIDRQPLTVAPETLLTEVTILMQEWGNSCSFATKSASSETDTIVRNNNSCVLVVANCEARPHEDHASPAAFPPTQLQGIFTERDLVELIATNSDLENMTVAEVMSREMITLTFTGSEDVFIALNLLKSNFIRHLPIVDDRGGLLGLVTIKNIRQQLQPVNLMKWRKVEEIINPEVVYAYPQDTIRDLARLMAQHKTSCVAIANTQVDPETNSSLIYPIGIITERDLVQFQNLNLDFEQPACKLMSTPLFLVSPEDTLWSVHQQMQQRRVRRLLVGGAKGEAIGIITQNSLLQVLDPTEMYGVIDLLQRQVCELETEREVFLQKRNSELEQEVQEVAAEIVNKNKQIQRNQTELRQAHQELSYHFQNSPLAFVEWDSDFCVQRWSEQAEQMFGWQESQLLGKNWRDWQFVVAEDVDGVVRIATRLLDGTEPRNISCNRNYTKDGSIIDCEWYNSVLLDNSGNLISIFSLVQDISDRKNALRERQQAELKLQIQAKQQKAIANLGQSALSEKNLVVLMEKAVILVADTLEVEYCKVLELLPDGKNLLLKTGVGWQDGLVGTATIRADPNSQAGYTLLSSEPVIVTNLLTETRFSGPDLLLDHEVISGMSAVIRGDDRPYGILGTHSTKEQNFSRDDVNFLVAISNILAQAIERHQVELTLQQSEQKFKAIFDQTFQFIGLLEPDGTLIEANKTALDFVGLTSKDVVGQLFWQTPWWSMSGKIQERIRQGIEQAAKGEFVRFEVEHPGTENRLVTVDFSLTPIEDDAGKVIMLIPEGRNISELKQVEADLQKSNRVLQAISSIQTQFLTDAEPGIIFDVMLDSLLELTESEYGFIGEIFIAADGSPIMDESYLKFRGRPYLKTHAITNIAWNEETRAFYAENAPKGMEFHNLQTLFGATIVTGEPVIANSPSDDPRRGGLPDGHPPLNAFLGIPFYKKNKMTGMVGVANRQEGYDEAIIDYLQPFIDTCSRIIEAHKSDRQRHQIEQKNQEQAALLNVANDAIMVRGLDNQLLFWNKGAERLYGWSEAEALEKDANELLYREFMKQLTQITKTVRNKGEWQGELNQVAKSGRKLVVESRWTLVKNEADNPQSYLIVNTDITEQKQLEAQFLRTQRLESLGTLAGGIAHDLNNILAPILGFAKLLPLRLSNIDEQTRGFFKIIETNAQRGSALVKQILTFAQGLEGDRGTIQIRHIIGEIRQVIKETFPKNIELEIDVARNLWTINADATQIHQVLMNLVVNARDAMVRGGKLQITAENFTIDADFARMHIEAREGNYILIAIADTGTGISPVILDRIFEPFFTTKEVGRGTGLGLSTTIGIIRSHGGFIDVYSEIGRGTQFQVFLPASETVEILSPDASIIPQGNGELILVVDDESQICDMNQAILENSNYQVLTASDGVNAIAIYAQNQQEISLVITDIMMPNMDGNTLIRTLKQINPQVKIIAVSGLISNKEILTKINDHSTFFMTKPYSNDDLLRAVYQSIYE